MSSPLPPDHAPSSPRTAADAIEDAAILWLAERDDGFSPERAREFARWLDTDTRHAATVARLEQTLGLLGELPEFRAALNTEFERAAPVVPFQPSPPVAVLPPPRAFPRTRAVLMAAAVVIGLFVGARDWWPASSTRYTTTAAGYERARLDDGSTLELNAASRAVVSYTTSQRQVQLEAGEAHFAVAPDEARPFVVNAGGVSVRAVGTAFNVRYTPEAIEVTVVEGKVRVARGGADGSTASLVVAGQRALVPREASVPQVEAIAPDALREALAWQGRLVEFSEAPLADVVRRFNARNRLQIVLADPALGARRVGGTFALDEAEAFVRLLTRDGEIAADPRGDTEIVLRRAR